MSQQQQQQHHQEATTKPDTDTNNLDYLAINRARWDERAPHVSERFLSHSSKRRERKKRGHVTTSARESQENKNTTPQPRPLAITTDLTRNEQHATSPDYAVAALISSPTLLSNTLTFDLPLLPSLQNKKTVHLQCHIGTDTLSLARLGASHVAGLDLSPASLHIARDLVSKAAGGERVTFVESDVYGAVQVLGAGKWEVVFTGIGALGWLPDIRRWAETVAGLLKPGGELFLREGHPVLFAIGGLDDGDGDAAKAAAEAGLLVIQEPYFESAGPIMCEAPSTYVRLEMEGKKFEAKKSVEWNHGLGEIVGALLAAGMRVTALVEHKSVPWNALPGMMVEVGGGEFFFLSPLFLDCDSVC